MYYISGHVLNTYVDIWVHMCYPFVMLCKEVAGMEKKDAQITVRMTSELKARLEAQAQKESRSVANLVHKVMRDYLAEEESRP